MLSNLIRVLAHHPSPSYHRVRQDQHAAFADTPSLGYPIAQMKLLLHSGLQCRHFLVARAHLRYAVLLLHIAVKLVVVKLRRKDTCSYIPED